jgi:hypothetical protein
MVMPMMRECRAAVLFVHDNASIAIDHGRLNIPASKGKKLPIFFGKISRFVTFFVA